MDWSKLPRFLRMPGFAAGGGHGAAGCSRPADAGPVEIREIASRRDLNRFVQLPWSIYAGDPQWIPRLNFEVKEFLDPTRHPFYLHGAAAKFLALREGKPVGRILVSDDPHYNQFHQTNVGCFGMFESVDDPAVAHKLLDAAAAWLAARGRSLIQGPIDYSTNYSVGLLIEGYDTPARVMMNYNPPYYAALMESWGLTKAKDLYAWWFTDPHDMIQQWKPRAEWLAKRGGITIRPFRRKDFDAEIRRCNEVYTSAFEHNWGFVPLSEAEFQWFARQMNRIANENQVLVAEYEGQPVGFSATLPDLNEATRPLNGRLSTFGLPLGALRLLWRLRKIRTARMLVLVVLERYRRRGVAELLIFHTLDFGKNVLHYTGAELSWTLEDNYLVNRTIERVGGQRYKTYRVYEKALG